MHRIAKQCQAKQSKAMQSPAKIGALEFSTESLHHSIFHSQSIQVQASSAEYQELFSFALLNSKSIYSQQFTLNVRRKFSNNSAESLHHPPCNFPPLSVSGLLGHGRMTAARCGAGQAIGGRLLEGPACVRKNSLVVVLSRWSHVVVWWISAANVE